MALVAWCRSNNLHLNADKAKDLVIDPRQQTNGLQSPLFINETELERLKTFKFLSTYISEDLTWCHHPTDHQKVPAETVLSEETEEIWHVTNFYRCTIESVLTTSITVWFGCTAKDRKALQRVIKTSQHIAGAAFLPLQDIYHNRVLRRTHNLIRDNTHPQHNLFTLLPSGRRYRSLRARTTRLANNFYPQTKHQHKITICAAPGHRSICTHLPKFYPGYASPRH